MWLECCYYSLDYGFFFLATGEIFKNQPEMKGESELQVRRAALAAEGTVTSMSVETRYGLA